MSLVKQKQESFKHNRTSSYRPHFFSVPPVDTNSTDSVASRSFLSYYCVGAIESELGDT